jgi:hypothetical protein
MKNITSSDDDDDDEELESPIISSWSNKPSVLASSFC